jgi:hypothetical protein
MFRLAWTQSVTRTRWLPTKLGVVGLAAMAAAGLLSLMVTWWASPLDRAHANVYNTFDERDIVPVGFALFAFTLGVIAGLIIRRTLPAMAATLVAFIGARLAVTYWVRPHLSAPLRIISKFQFGSGGSPNPGDWVVSSQTINAAGKVIGDNGGIGSGGRVGFDVGRDGTINFVGVGLCPNKAPVPTLGSPGGPSSSVQAAFQECADKLGIREILHYQPAGRYWAFQWYETAIFIGLALGLVGFCFWWIRSRRDRRTLPR